MTFLSFWIHASTVMGGILYADCKIMSKTEMESSQALLIFRYHVEQMTREFRDKGIPISDVVWEGWTYDG